MLKVTTFKTHAMKYPTFSLTLILTARCIALSLTLTSHILVRRLNEINMYFYC